MRALSVALVLLAVLPLASALDPAPASNVHGDLAPGAGAAPTDPLPCVYQTPNPPFVEIRPCE